MNITPIVAEKYTSILKETLGQELYEQFAEYIRCLFNESHVGFDRSKPLGERFFIILTRKGFVLWEMAMMCGLIDDEREYDSNTIVSDRLWTKMSSQQRVDAIKGKHVFILDDCILTGKTIMEIYRDLNAKQCKSRNVFCLSASNNFNLYNNFETFNHCITVEADERREQHSKFMKAIYDMAIPFTAESPVFVLKDVNHYLLAALKNLSQGENGWNSVSTSLDFHLDNISESNFVINAPESGVNDNMFFYGLRVCYRKVSESATIAEAKYDMVFVPCAMFSLLDYQNAKKILLDNLEQNNDLYSWLRNQLTNYENDRIRKLVYRSLLYWIYSDIVRKFNEQVMYNFSSVSKLETYKLNGIPIEEYHFHSELLAALRELSKNPLDLNSSNIIIDAQECKRIARALEGTFWCDFEVPHQRKNLEGIYGIMAEDREPRTNEITKLTEPPGNRKLHPVISFEAENNKSLGVHALDCIRRSIASLHYAFLSVKNNDYLAGAFAAGEGSRMIKESYLEFALALYLFVQKQNLQFPYDKTKFHTDKIRNFHDCFCNEFGLRTRPDDDSYFKIILDTTPGNWISNNLFFRRKGIDPMLLRDSENYNDDGNLNEDVEKIFEPFNRIDNFVDRYIAKEIT